MAASCPQHVSSARVLSTCPQHVSSVATSQLQQLLYTLTYLTESHRSRFRCSSQRSQLCDEFPPPLDAILPLPPLLNDILYAILLHCCCPNPKPPLHNNNILRSLSPLAPPPPPPSLPSFPVPLQDLPDGLPPSPFDNLDSRISFNEFEPFGRYNFDPFELFEKTKELNVGALFACF